jgi:hypothetical protein
MGVQDSRSQKKSPKSGCPGFLQDSQDSLQGHDRVYARSHKISPGKVVEDSAPGTIYVISVSGPKMYEFRGGFESLMFKMQTNRQIHQVISIDQNALEFRASDIDGNMIDQFRLDKREGHSALVEQAPGTGMPISTP